MQTSPDKFYDDRQSNSMRPSWSLNEGYLSQLHRNIYSLTSGLDGWQQEADAYKLFEMGYFAGDAILEIGTYAGRSAVVELKGALSNPNRQHPPQFYGIDIDLGAVVRTYNVLREHSLHGYAILFPGNIDAFFQMLPLSPTMVFVDGDHSYQGCQSDLKVLARYLSADTPVLFHDWSNVVGVGGEYGVRAACDEWEQEGYARFLGHFGCSALYMTTEKCARTSLTIAHDQFRALQQSFMKMLVNTCNSHGIPIA